VPKHNIFSGDCFIFTTVVLINVNIETKFLIILVRYPALFVKREQAFKANRAFLEYKYDNILILHQVQMHIAHPSIHRYKW